MKKYSLIFDGNFWLIKTFNICQRIKQGKGMNFINNPEEDKQFLLWKLAVDFAAEIRRFSDVTHQVVYCVDYSSWRKQVQTDQDYKGNRVQSTDIDWNAVFEVHTEFIEALKQLGVVTSKIRYAEADDLIYGWTSYLNQLGENAIIISGDNDLLQLIQYDKTDNVSTIYYNKFDKNLHAFQGFEEWVNIEEKSDVTDIFNMNTSIFDNVKTDFKNILKREKIKIEEINTNDFVFKKILKGDGGDNVSSLYTKIKETKRGPQCYTVTEKQSTEILQKFKAQNFSVKQHHFFDDKYITQICDITKTHLKIEDKSIDELIEKWKLNRNLMMLHKNCIPVDIFEAMMADIESKIKNKISPILLDSLVKKEEILKKTTYKSDLNPNDTSLLKNVKVNTEVKIDNDNKSFNDSFWNELLS